MAARWCGKRRPTGTATYQTSSTPTETTPSAVAYAGRVTPDEALELALCASDFGYFLRYWQFVNRETGEICTFADLWPGQAQLVERMVRSPWLYALKAGKLGFSELECAYDGWVARFAQPNARVHLFSRGGLAAAELLGWVKFGLLHLPRFMRLPVVEDQAGANTSKSLKLEAGPDDKRTIVSYASGPDISIDQTCTHLHADEFARWPYGEKTWTAAQSTIAPDGSCHIITRGAGRNWAGKIYTDVRAGKIASQTGAVMQPFFAPFNMRPGRGGDWRTKQATSYTKSGLGQWAPATWQEALQGDIGLVYPMFESPEGRHVHAGPTVLKDCARICVGLDPGGGHPTAMVLLGTRASGGIHQYDEFYLPGAGLEDIVARLGQWATDAGIEPYRMRVVCDGSEPVLIASLVDYGFDAAAADKDRQTGIMLVSQRLNANQLSVDPSCAATIDEYFDYRWSEETDAQTKVVYAGERPIRHHADAMDATRYAVVDLATYEAPKEVVTRTGRRY